MFIKRFPGSLCPRPTSCDPPTLKPQKLYKKASKSVISFNKLINLKSDYRANLQTDLSKVLTTWTEFYVETDWLPNIVPWYLVGRRPSVDSTARGFGFGALP